jgi:tight adherence protein C
MKIIFYAAVGLAMFSLTLLLIVLTPTRSSRAVAQRVRELARLQGSGLRADSHRKIARAYLERQVHAIRIRLGMAESATLKERISRAGYKGIFAEDLYLAGRTLGPVLAFLLGSLINSNRGFWMISLPAFTYLLPDVLLQQRIRRRRNRIRSSMPDMIDLLVICVDAGLGIDQALLRVTRELSASHPDIADELIRLNREQQAGKPRWEAWQDLQKRVDLPDLSAFVNMLVQAERFGTPISRALSHFADSLRLKRRLKAEELAAKTTVKIVFPLVLFIFPSLFIVLLGPAVLTMMRGLSSLSH